MRKLRVRNLKTRREKNGLCMCKNKKSRHFTNERKFQRDNKRSFENSVN